MPATSDYLAIDIGASGGRAVLGSFDGQRLSLREIHRFANGPVRLPTGLHWDLQSLFQEVKRSLTLARGPALVGVGIDTWGVDYGLLSATGELLAPPFHYRDTRTQGLMDAAFQRIPRTQLYARTGVQFQPFNTLYQLLADQRSGDTLSRAQKLLFIPDLLHFWLTGVARSEQTNASTSQLYDTAANAWAVDVVKLMGLPAHILPDVAGPGTPVGPLLRAMVEETGTGPVTVIAPASHDTASAVAAVPAVGSDWAYISSGTWSLVGRELAAPIRTPEALVANFTNECGVESTIRFHKNVAGMWLVQECQRVWAEQGRSYTFDQLVEIAATAPPFAALIDPDHASFAEFGDMPGRIRDFCARTRQVPPVSDGPLIRCILESLALKCRIVIDALEAMTGPVRTIHIVGGGTQNRLLCQFAANAAARPVIAGPVEATAVGNLMSQALAHRRVTSLAQIRAVITASLRPTGYDPQDTPDWAAANDRMRELTR